MSSTRLAAVALVTSCAACVVTPTVKTTQIGLPLPPREEQCSLTLIENAQGYEEIGEIVVVDEELRPYNDPALLALVKPDACKLGGEVVTGMSQAVNDGITKKAHDVYIVWHRKPPPAGPTAF